MKKFWKEQQLQNLIIALLIDKYSLNSNAIDFKNILLALNIKKYFYKKP